MEQSDILVSHCALQVALETMEERCKQLQERLIIVEEENACLHQQYEKNNSAVVIKAGDENTIIQNQQKKIEELKKEKSQLAHHIFMVSSENRQLWKRLTRLTRANKTLGNHLTKISDTLKQHPTSEVPTALTYSFKDIPGLLRGSDKNSLPDNEEKEHSLEEISLKLINSIMLEKSELEQQYAEIVELQSNTEINLKNIGFTYPEDVNVDSLEQLKYHDTRLLQIKDALLKQGSRLKSTLENLKRINKNKICNACKNRVEKLTRQAGTQFDLETSVKENGATQTSLPDDLMTEEKLKSDDDNICPLCAAVFKKSVPFEIYHEHVVNHLTKEVPDGFEMVSQLTS